MNTLQITRHAVECHWDANETLHSVLLGIMETLGIENLCAPPRGPVDSLLGALKWYVKQYRKELLIDYPRSKTTLKVERLESATHDGYEVIAVQHGKQDNDYPKLFSAKVNGSETVEILSGWSMVSDIYALQSRYEYNRKHVAPAGITKMLTNLIELLNGTCKKVGGGLYHLPDGAANAWKELSTAINAGTDSVITWHRLEINETEVQAIMKGITSEILLKCSGMKAEIESGKLGKRAIENRQGLLGKLRRKAKEYEGILDSPLQDVRKALQEAETAVDLANMLAIQDDLAA